MTGKPPALLKCTTWKTRKTVWIKPTAVLRILPLDGKPEQRSLTGSLSCPAVPPGFEVSFSGTVEYISWESGVELLRILGEPAPEMPEVL